MFQTPEIKTSQKFLTDFIEFPIFCPTDDSVDVTSEPVEQDLPLSSSSSSSSASSSATSAAAGGGGGGGGGVGGLPNGANNFKGGQMEVELGGSVTLQCPQGK